MIDKIKSIVNPNSYNINIDKNTLYINNFTKINTINDNTINIDIDDINIIIKGNNISIIKLLESEILFNIDIYNIIDKDIIIAELTALYN